MAYGTASNGRSGAVAACPGCGETDRSVFGQRKRTTLVQSGPIAEAEPYHPGSAPARCGLQTSTARFTI